MKEYLTLTGNKWFVFEGKRHNLTKAVKYKEAEKVQEILDILSEQGWEIKFWEPHFIFEREILEES